MPSERKLCRHPKNIATTFRLFSNPLSARSSLCRETAEAATRVAALLAILYRPQTVSASSSSQNTVFNRRLASSMPLINTDLSAAVIADRQDTSLIQCGLLCSTQAGCIAVYYSQSLKRCRLLTDITLPAVKDDSLYIVISGGVNPINIALYKPASASSEHSYNCCPASNAVDGQFGTILHTTCVEPYPWLMVDLQYVYRVTEVTVYTSCHCCYERMHDIEIRVRNASESMAASDGAGLFDGAFCYHRAGSFTQCALGETYTCAAGAVGRYLTVQLTLATGDRCFQPSEVVVKGELLPV